MPKPKLPSLNEAWLRAIFGGEQLGSSAKSQTWLCSIFGVGQPRSNGNSQEIPSMERVVFVGETALQLGVMTWVAERYQNCKKRVDLKEKQKSLATVKKAASWGQLYRLSGKLSRLNTMHPGYIKPSNSELFFAYLGAVYLSKGGVDRAAKWIGDILNFEEVEGPAKPASDAEEENEVEEKLVCNRTSSHRGGPHIIAASSAFTSPPKYSKTPLPPSVGVLSNPVSPKGNDASALSQVNEKLAQRGVKLEWEERVDEADHAWSVKTMYDGRKYTGRAATKKLAKAQAAEQILRTLTAQSGRRP